MEIRSVTLLICPIMQVIFIENIQYREMETRMNNFAYTFDLNCINGNISLKSWNLSIKYFSIYCQDFSNSLRASNLILKEFPTQVDILEFCFLLLQKTYDILYHNSKTFNMNIKNKNVIINYPLLMNVCNFQIIYLLNYSPVFFVH